MTRYFDAEDVCVGPGWNARRTRPYAVPWKLPQASGVDPASGCSGRGPPLQQRAVTPLTGAWSTFTVAEKNEKRTIASWALMPPSELGPLGQAIIGLGALLEAEGEHHQLIVVGGVAINLARIRERVTGDVDIIARIERTPAGDVLWVQPEPFPESLQRAIRQVAVDFGLREDWMNAVVGRQWEYGLPPWIGEDITWHDYGGLRLGVPGRRTLTTLKLYAAVDQGPKSVHAEDLLYLSPSDEELAEAAAWVALQDVSPEFAENLTEAVAYVAEHRR